MKDHVRGVVAVLLTYAGAAGVCAGDSVPEQGAFRTLEAIGADPNADHGACVAMGNGVLAVGAPHDVTAFSNQGGKVRVWDFYAHVPPGDDPFFLDMPAFQDGGGAMDGTDGDQYPGFGSSIALGAGLVVVGAPGFNSTEEIDVGAALIYQRLPNGYQHVATVYSDRAYEDSAFGTDIVFDDQGDLYVSAPYARGGMVERFRQDAAGAWSHMETFAVDDDVIGDEFGHDLAWDDVSRSVVIAAPGRNEVLVQSVADSDSLPTPPMSTLFAPPGAVNFGSAVDADSGFIAVGAPAGSAGGTVYLYERVGFSWNLHSVIPAPEDIDYFGESVAINGTDLLVGSNSFNTAHGVHVYTIPEDSDPVRTRVLLGETEGFGRSMAVASGYALAGDPSVGTAGGAYLSLVAADCNANGILDSEELANDPGMDCDGNGLLDACEDDPALDCDDNGQFDACEIADGTASDCNTNGVIDECELADGTSSDCNGNGIVDSCDIADGTAIDCNGNGAIDECEIADGTGADCDGNGVLDECDQGDTALDCNDNGSPDLEEGPTFCVDSSAIPLDLIVIADPSGSDADKLDGLCDTVFQEAVASLQGEFDVRAAWVSVMEEEPDTPCHDWTMPGGTPVPVCSEQAGRFIDDPDGDGEEWGDASAVMTTPYESHLLGQLDGWEERDAVLILIPISDEGPQDGGTGTGSNAACDCEDQSSMWNLIRQAWIENVQVLPMPTEGTPTCVFDSADPSSLMSLTAAETGGSVVDAREWPSVLTSEELAQDLEDAIRAAVAASPRIKSIPEDFDDDGIVGVNDLLALIGVYGSMAGDDDWDPRYDLDQDGSVGVNDLLTLLEVYGETCDGRASRIVRKPTTHMNQRPDSHSNQD